MRSVVENPRSESGWTAPLAWNVPHALIWPSAELRLERFKKTGPDPAESALGGKVDLDLGVGLALSVVPTGSSLDITERAIAEVQLYRMAG